MARNRVLNQVEKILSVTEEVEISELRAGVSRHHRMKGFAVPTRVLLELCRQVEWCRVDGRTVAAITSLLPEQILASTELSLYRILVENGKVLPRPRFEELCLADGMNRTTFYAYIEYSPVLEKYAPGIYGLRG